MQFSLYINQEKSVEWGLNVQQSIFFSFLYTVPSWADPVSINGNVYYSVSKTKIAEELPLISGNADTIKRYFQQLEKAGLIERFSTKTRAFFRLTAKAKSWNKTESKGREKNPDIKEKVGKKIPTTSGKKSLPPRKKNPPYHITNNPITKDHKNNTKPEHSRFDIFYSEYPVKKSKAQARKVFAKLNPDDLLFQRIIRALKAQINNRAQAKAANVWMPEWKHPSTWLTQQCWEDDLTEIEQHNTQTAKNINDLDHDDESWADLVNEVM
jgi:hypothetical protein